MPVIAHNVAINFGSITLTGDLVHDPAQHDLYLQTEEGNEDISTALTGYALLPKDGCVFVKDWSEHSDLAKNLTDAGLVESMRVFDIPAPFKPALSVTEVRVLSPANT